MSPSSRLADYTPLGRIGLGATAEILLAEHDGVRVALKRLHPHLRGDEDVWRAFVDEARLLSLMPHPGIVRVIDLVQDGDETFMALELVDGPSLLGLQKIASERGVPLPLGLCLHVLASVADALAFVHDARDPDSGAPLLVVHRDVAPANVLVARDGAVKLTDFGIARSRQARRLGILSADTTRGGMVKGRRGYVAPEQVKGEQLDARADLYSLGVVVWELLAGRRMHTDTNALDLIEKIVHQPAPPAASVRTEIPMELGDLIDRMLRKQRDERPASAAIVRDSARALCAGHDVVTVTAEQVLSLGLPSLRTAPRPTDFAVR